MTLKEVKFVPYGRKAKFIEINVKDNQNNVIDFFKIYHKKSNLEKNERNDNPKKVLKILKQKYDFDFEQEEPEKDLRW